MDGGTPAAGPVDLSLQVVPFRLLAAQVALGQLDEQGGGRLADPGQILDVQQPVRVAGPAAGQAVQPLEGLSLVLVQVAHGMEDDGPALPPVGVNPQHRLLRHRAAGQEHGRGLAKQSGDLGLELGHHAAVAVPVGDRPGRDAGQHRGGGHRPVAGQEHGALAAQFGLLGGGQRIGGRHRCG